ncbi:hypothetical protein [Kineococcus sp. SYSU DK003]|uniref:hypothetical protein n=1 Tax=Kineococcus sp. SYSU DK003 TaxID=3383124 RepID=UPI003D7DF1F4
MGITLLALALFCLPCSGHLYRSGSRRGTALTAIVAAGMTVVHAVLLSHPQADVAPASVAVVGHHQAEINWFPLAVGHHTVGLIALVVNLVQLGWGAALLSGPARRNPDVRLTHVVGGWQAGTRHRHLDPKQPHRDQESRFWIQSGDFC